MNIFSDMVWDDILTKTKYVEHFSKTTINLFKCNENEMQRIVIKVNKEISLLNKEGFEWLLKNLNDDSVELLEGKKPYKEDRNVEIFDLIEKGSMISKGDFFEYFNRLIAL